VLLTLTALHGTLAFAGLDLTKQLYCSWNASHSPLDQPRFHSPGFHFGATSHFTGVLFAVPNGPRR
jgi:hypothetical protein